MRSSKTDGLFIKWAVVMALIAPITGRAEEKSVKPSGFVAVPEESETSSTSAASKEAAKPSKQTVQVVQQVQVPSYDGLNADEALRKAWLDELDAIKKNEEAEVQAVQARDQAERTKYQTQHELTQKQKKIYDYKNKQEEYAEEIERMKSEVVEMNGRVQEAQKDLTSAEERAKIHEGKFNESKGELEQTKATLQVSVENLRKTREEASKKINGYLIEMQRIRADIATSEADIARADNDRSRAEAEELQVRGQWSSLSVRAQALRDDKVRVLNELTDMKTRLAAAKKDYEEIHAVWQRAEKEKQDAVQLAAKEKAAINTEMRKLESDSSLAFNEKANAEAEKVRLAAEIEKLQTDLAYVKKRNMDAHAEDSESQGTVMESRLAFETAKADLTKELAVNEASQLQNDATAIKLRGLASAAEGSDMSDAHKPWVASKVCKITRTPASTGDVAGSVHANDRLIAAPSGGGYVKILNSSGRPAYVPMSCGHFSE